MRGIAVVGAVLLCLAAWAVGRHGGSMARVAPAPAPAPAASALPEPSMAHVAPAAPAPPTESDACQAHGDMQETVDRVFSDPEELSRLLGEFRLAAGTARGEELSIQLGQVKDPLVEEVAIELVRGGGGLARRIAGLDLLDRLDIENEVSRKVVLEVLWTDPSVEIQRAAIYALHYGVPAPDARRDVLNALAPHTRSADAEVRRRAVIAVAEWAPDAGSLAPVLEALRDASPDVRAGAAFALGEVRVAAPVVQQALARTVADEAEDWEVRRIAWGSLGRFPLREDEHAAYERFRGQVEAFGEASGSPASEGAEE